MRTLRMIAATGLTLVALAACGDDDPSTPPVGPDPGVAACQAAQASYEANDEKIPDAVIAGLKASRNADLREVGAELERLSGLDDSQLVEELDAALAALGKLGEGCAAVGVTLPEEMISPQG